MQRRRDVRTQSLTTLIAIALLALCTQGCATRHVALWYIEPGLVEVSSTGEIESMFRSLFAGYSYPSDRFRTKEVSAEAARFLFVTAYPYRGPGILSIYAYEQLKP